LISDPRVETVAEASSPRGHRRRWPRCGRATPGASWSTYCAA